MISTIAPDLTASQRAAIARLSHRRGRPVGRLLHNHRYRRDPTHTYSWTFGDGGISSLKNPAHTYLSAGSYTPKVIVTDSTGQTATATATVTVTAPTAVAGAPYPVSRRVRFG